MKRKMLLTIVALIAGTTFMFAAGNVTYNVRNIRLDNREIRHEKRELRRDRVERNIAMSRGRYEVAAHIQRHINFDKRNLAMARRDRNYHLNNLYR